MRLHLGALSQNLAQNNGHLMTTPSAAGIAIGSRVPMDVGIAIGSQVPMDVTGDSGWKAPAWTAGLLTPEQAQTATPEQVALMAPEQATHATSAIALAQKADARQTLLYVGLGVAILAALYLTLKD